MVPPLRPHHGQQAHSIGLAATHALTSAYRTGSAADTAVRQLVNPPQASLRPRLKRTLHRPVEHRRILQHKHGRPLRHIQRSS